MNEQERGGGAIASPLTLYGLSEEDCAVSAWILDMLRGESLATVMECIVYLESKDNRLMIEGFANLRDSLNHLSLAAQKSGDPDDRDHHLSEAMEHLRRAFTNPYQNAIDGRLGLLERREWIYQLRHQLVGDDILAPRERRQRLDGAKNKLIAARSSKGQNRITESAELFRACYDYLEDLKRELTPTKNVLVVRLLFWGIPILWAVVGFAIGIVGIKIGLASG